MEQEAIIEDVHVLMGRRRGLEQAREMLLDQAESELGLTRGVLRDLARKLDAELGKVNSQLSAAMDATLQSDSIAGNYEFPVEAAAVDYPIPV